MRKPRTSIIKNIKRPDGICCFQSLRLDLNDKSENDDKLISIITEDSNYTEHGIVSEFGYPDDQPDSE